MAGEWLKIEHSLPDKPEVREIAAILFGNPVTPEGNAQSVTPGVTPGVTKVTGLSRNAQRSLVTGSLFRVWTVFSEQSTDGVIPFYDFEDIDEIAAIPGFGLAMQAVGWLVKTDQPGLSMTSWDNHLSKSAKSRAQVARRVAASKNKARGATDSVTGSDTRSVTKSVTPSVTESVNREEKRREEEVDSSLRSESCSTGVERHPPSGGVVARVTESAGRWSSRALDCERIYQRYPKHVGKAAALKSIERAVKAIRDRDGSGVAEAVSWLLGRVSAFADSSLVRNSAREYVPNPATWFNQGRYDDGADEWEPGSTGDSDKKEIEVC